MSGGLWRNSPNDGIQGQSRQEVEHGRRERTTQADVNEPFETVKVLMGASSITPGFSPAKLDA